MYKSVLQKFDLRALVLIPMLSVHKTIHPGRKNGKVKKSFQNVYYSVLGTLYFSKANILQKYKPFPW